MRPSSRSCRRSPTTRRRARKECRLDELKQAPLAAISGRDVPCVEVGLVKRVHTLFGRNAQQVVYELQVREEVEGVRQEVLSGIGCGGNDTGRLVTW